MTDEKDSLNEMLDDLLEVMKMVNRGDLEGAIPLLRKVIALYEQEGELK